MVFRCILVANNYNPYSNDRDAVPSCAYSDLFFLRSRFYSIPQRQNSIHSLRLRIMNLSSKGITPTLTGRKFTVRRIQNRVTRPMAHRLSAGMALTVSVRIAGGPVPDTEVSLPGSTDSNLHKFPVLRSHANFPAKNLFYLHMLKNVTEMSS